MTETGPVATSALKPETVEAETAFPAVIDRIPEYEVKRTLTGKLRARLMEK